MQEDKEAAALCYGWDSTAGEWRPILVDATGAVKAG